LNFEVYAAKIINLHFHVVCYKSVRNSQSVSQMSGVLGSLRSISLIIFLLVIITPRETWDLVYTKYCQRADSKD